jgi:hypothetical protein
VREHEVAGGGQLERLVAEVLDHPLEAGEVAPHAVVPVVGVRLGRHLGRYLDDEALVGIVQDGLDAALRVVVEESLHDLEIRIRHAAGTIRLG